MELGEHEYYVGPIQDRDQGEILPLGLEEVHETLEGCMGYYAIHSDSPTVEYLKIDGSVVRDFLQQDWDRVMSDLPARGFLYAYKSPTYATGRLLEEMIAQLLLPHWKRARKNPDQVLLSEEAREQGFFAGLQGMRSDDVVLHYGEEVVVVECKASFAGSRYLRRCVPKAVNQLAATVALSDKCYAGGLCFADIKRHQVWLASYDEADLATRPAFCVADFRGRMSATLKKRPAGT